MIQIIWSSKINSHLNFEKPTYFNGDQLSVILWVFSNSPSLQTVKQVIKKSFFSHLQLIHQKITEPFLFTNHGLLPLSKNFNNKFWKFNKFLHFLRVCFWRIITCSHINLYYTSNYPTPEIFGLARVNSKPTTFFLPDLQLFVVERPYIKNFPSKMTSFEHRGVKN